MGYDSTDRNDDNIYHCPFCNGISTVLLYNPPFTNQRYFYVQCDCCGAMTNPVSLTVNDAIKLWNRRYNNN